MIKWAGGLMIFYGSAHTLGALAAEGAAKHAGTWLSRDLWGESLSEMSPAMSAYWLSINSFGPPVVLLGCSLLWMNRRGIAPPAFIGWSLAAWVAIGTFVAGPGVGQDLILLAACTLIILAARRTRRRSGPASVQPGRPATAMN